MSVLTFLLILLTLVYIYFKWKFSYWQRKGVQSVKGSFPFGSASKFLLQQIDIGESFRNVYEKYKTQGLRYVGYYLFATPMLVVLDLNLIKTMLTTDFRHFTDHANYLDEEHEPLTATLFALRGQKWKHLRAKLTPTFTSGKMKMMFHTLVACTDGLKEVMDDIVEQRAPAEIKDVAARYTTDVIGSCAFGLDCNCLESANSEFREFGKRVVNFSKCEHIVRLFATVSPSTVAALRLKVIAKEVSHFIMKVVKQTIDYRETNNVKRNDLMHLLIQLKNNVKVKEDADLGQLRNEESSNTVDDGLSIHQIAAQVLIFFVGGFETTSATLSFCLFELVTTPCIQEKLRAEIKDVLTKHNGNITYEAIMEMHYMDKCIQETLRKYPATSVIFRTCTETYAIPETNLCIEKGTILLLPIMGLHFDPEYYPNPEKFDPERFSVENIASRDHFAWLPFGEGPRKCIGLRFALLQIKVALTVLLKDYEFTLSSKTESPLEIDPTSVIMAANGGIWLNVKKAE